jgi:anti-anti-sigma factor
VDHAKIERLRMEHVGGVVVLEVVPVEIDSPSLAREFGEELNLILQANLGDKLLLDFGSTQYMSSSAFGALLAFGKRAEEAGVRVRVCGFIPAVKFGAEILSIGRLIPLHETRHEALAAFGA